MENKAHALIAGAFTLGLLTAAILLGLWLKRDQIEWVPYQIATRLSIPGLSPQAAVRYRGLDVGKVQDIRFDPNAPGQLLIDIRVQPDTPITRSTYASLAYQGVTGIAYVQLDDDGTEPVRLPSSEQNVARIAMRPSLFDQLQNQGLSILQQTENITQRLNSLLTPQNEKTIISTLENVSDAATRLADIPKQLEPTLSQLPRLTTQAEQTLRSVNALATSVNSLTVQLQQTNGPLDKLGNAAEDVSAVATRLENETLPLAGDVRSSLRTLNRTLESLGDRPQSVLFGSPETRPGPGEPGFADATK